MKELLSNLLKPKTLNDIVGQKHLVGNNKILNNMVKNQKLFSFILTGKSGSGKNSIANALVNDLNQNYRYFNAVIHSKKDLDIIFEEAKLYKNLIVIADEFHRLNKAKQDLFLPYIENNLITIIILTSQNPYFAINPAIRSRCQIFKLEELTETDIYEGINKASKYLEDLNITEEAKRMISKLSNGDLRFAYNLLEVAYYYNENHLIDENLIKEINPQANKFLDKNADYYYDLLSGLQKSIRGSDVDASIYYLALLIERGDIESILRRLIVIAYEDISLANPTIGIKVMAAYQNAITVGLPEARIILSQIVIEMALSVKSNSSYKAIDEAINLIKLKDYGVNPNVKIHTTTYKYPHDYKNIFVNQEYLPRDIKSKRFYVPKNIGFEKNIKEYYDFINELKKNPK
jgi:replication-associated recombination protein A